jgi:hypothetical protein
MPLEAEFPIMSPAIHPQGCATITTAPTNTLLAGTPRTPMKSPAANADTAHTANQLRSPPEQALNAVPFEAEPLHQTIQPHSAAAAHSSSQLLSHVTPHAVQHTACACATRDGLHTVCQRLCAAAHHLVTPADTTTHRSRQALRARPTHPAVP